MFALTVWAASLEVCAWYQRTGSSSPASVKIPQGLQTVTAHPFLPGSAVEQRSWAKEAYSEQLPRNCA